jgi:esterase/lipase
MGKKELWITIPLILMIGYLMGPKPPPPGYNKELPVVPVEATALEQYIAQNESKHKIKPDNEARIVWKDSSIKQKTDYSIVYLHGFSASQGEGEPTHRKIANKFGCNLYLSRLAEHGIDTTEPLIKLTVEKYWQSAKEAYAIGKQLGNKVILMGTSTGATLALKLAAEFPDVHALVLLSPNIALYDGTAWVLNNPWGLQMARIIKGSRYIYSQDKRELFKKYWYDRFRIEGVVALQELLESSMNTITFNKVKQPLLCLYYYKDDIHQDSVVKVDAMKDMYTQLGTPAEYRRALAMPQAGNHVIGSYIRSNDVEGVQQQIEIFLKEILKIPLKK